VSLVKQELVTLPEHMISPSGFSGAGVTRSLFLCIGFVDRCVSFCTFSFGHSTINRSYDHKIVTCQTSNPAYSQNAMTVSAVIYLNRK
jgi:hypothetical protein